MLRSPWFWLGSAVGAGFLLFFFWRVDLGELLDAFGQASYLYLVPAAAAYFVALAFRAMRWQFLLRPVRDVPWRRLYPVLAVGYMANNVLPMRLGELVRSYYLARREPVSASTALATILVERVFDGIALLFLLAVAALFLPVAGLAEHVSDAVRVPVSVVVVAAVAPFLAALTLMVVAALRPLGFLRVLSFFTGRLPQRVTGMVDGLLSRFVEGFRGLDRPRRLAALLLWSLPVWLAEAVVFYLVAVGFGIDDHFSSMGLLMAAMLVATSLSNLATAVPSSPGSVGPFELLAALALEFLGVERDLASAYALVLHVVLLLPVAGIGILHLVTRGVRLGDLVREGRADQSSIPSADQQPVPAADQPL